MHEDSMKVSVPRLFRPRKDQARLTFGHEREYSLPLDHPLARLIEWQLEVLPEDLLLWAMIDTLIRHWPDDSHKRPVPQPDPLVGIMRGAYRNRKKIRETRRGKALFQWKDGHVLPPEVTILPYEDEDDGDAHDTLGRIKAYR